VSIRHSGALIKETERPTGMGPCAVPFAWKHGTQKAWHHKAMS
jgi:hypothetical protein